MNSLDLFRSRLAKFFRVFIFNVSDSYLSFENNLLIGRVF